MNLSTRQRRVLNFFFLINFTLIAISQIVLYCLISPLKLVSYSCFIKLDKIFIGLFARIIGPWLTLLVYKVKDYRLGPDPNEIIDLASPSVKILIVCNHQTVMDAVIMYFGCLDNKFVKFVLVWSKYYRFRINGLIHKIRNDFGIDSSFKKGDFVEYWELTSRNYNTVLLCPEGAFRNVYLESSFRYAEKNGLPQLTRTVWPRTRAFLDIVDKRNGFTYIIDTTIIYDNIDKLTRNLFLHTEQLMGSSFYSVIRVFEIIDDDKSETINDYDQIVNDFNKIQSLETVEQSDCVYRVPRSKLNESWLQQLWLSKDSMMNSFYQDKDNFVGKFKPNCYNQINLFHIMDFLLANSVYIPMGSTIIYLVYLSIAAIFKLFI
ncbi:acyl-CoA:lysophosphatidylglycerol acyltransferase 1-like isoform X2 [Panonychus citri]|uniref:acyl-CoA:lysophosphatidylglycerol acyltransferase 1-like isoform X2 n=1 Tax=Panonychus citri TaxID=50023 RepID=UPI002307D9AC|nr:acyl-CoA:lysophosphatidylglycerol acyltransferase 1-like isoform X2 [Panonychus citri]